MFTKSPFKKATILARVFEEKVEFESRCSDSEESWCNIWLDCLYGKYEAQDPDVQTDLMAVYTKDRVIHVFPYKDTPTSY